MMTEGKILEKILFDRKFPKGKFAKQVGMSRQTLNTVFKEVKIPDKWLDKICEVLDIESSEFAVYAPVIQQGNGNATIHQIIGTGDLREIYEKQLADKDKIIALLERRILELEK
jgi:DNA-binding Xre family transcriptional regulator